MTARALVWAEVLAEAGAAVAPDPVRGIPLDEAGRADLAVPVDRALRVAPGLARGRHGRGAGPGPGVAVRGAHGRVPGPGRRRPSEAAARDRGDRAGGMVPGGVRGRRRPGAAAQNSAATPRAASGMSRTARTTVNAVTTETSAHSRQDPVRPSRGAGTVRRTATTTGARGAPG